MAVDYRSVLIVVGLTGVALVLHLFLGWAWAVAAGLAAGFIPRITAWWYGGVVVMLDWLVLIVWNFVVAWGPTLRMIETVGPILGNMPGWAFVAVTLLMAFGLGAFAGLVGRQWLRAFDEVRARFFAAE